MKALMLEDFLFTRESLRMPAVQRRLQPLNDIAIEYAKDPNYEGLSSPAAFVGKMERGGPEGWITYGDDIRQKIKNADLLLVHASGVTEELLRTGENLKLVFCFRSGVDGINIQAAKDMGIAVCNCPSRLAQPVADMTVALMLCECRGLLRRSLHATNGKWLPDDIQDSSNAALCNLTVGLVGYGGIARKVAKRLVDGFGARVLAYDPYIRPDVMRNDGVLPATMEDLLAYSDIVSLHMKQTDQTRHMFSSEAFGKMKPTAILVNTARGGLVDQKALVQALRDKTIRGAALDVYEKEPLPADSPLLELDNVTLMPHIAGTTSDIIANTMDLVCEELARYLSGQPLINRIV